MSRKERALKNLKQMCGDGRYLGSGSHVPLEVLEDFEVAIKALKQKPRKGHWIKNELPSRDAHECSECSNSALIDEWGNEQLTDFCPHCGADMRGEEE